MWMTVQEASEYLGVSTKTIKRRAKKGVWSKKYEFIENGHKGKTKTLFLQILSEGTLRIYQRDKSKN